MKAAIAAALSAAALAGCAGFGSKDVQRYFVLEVAPPKSAAPASAPRSGPTLLIAPTGASSFYDTQEIVFSRTEGQRNYYQFSSWTEPPARTLDRLLAVRLDNTGNFAAVVPTTSGVRGSLLLRAQLVEMYHDVSTEPGEVDVTLDVSLSDPATRVLVARRSFVAAVPVASADAVGAVHAFDLALTRILDDVAAWTSERAAAPRPVPTR
jgi:cholesterol transport system auxiliary component